MCRLLRRLCCRGWRGLGDEVALVGESHGNWNREEWRFP